MVSILRSVQEDGGTAPRDRRVAAQLRGQYTESASYQDLVTMGAEDLDDAIAQVSNALRMLLELGLQRREPRINQRSDFMANEGLTPNAAERYDVFVVENYEDSAGAEKSDWLKVGVGFPHKDGDGLSVELRALPVSGKLVLRWHRSKPPLNDK